MTDPSYTAVALVIDRSGSMEDIREEAQATINGFLDDQRRATDYRTVRISTFDDRFEQFCPSTPAPEVPTFELKPRGMTALHDAIGRGITEFGEELAALPEDKRPGKVVFVIMTDGYENASQEWDQARVRALVVDQQQKWSWDVVYLGANQDAVLVGGGLGVAAGSSLSYSASKKGLRASTGALGAYVASVASAGPRSASFSDKDRAAALDE